MEDEKESSKGRPSNQELCVLTQTLHYCQLQLALAWSIARWLRGESLPGEGGCDLRMESIEEQVG